MWDSEERRKYMELNNLDPYKILGVKKDSSLKNIKKKYHALALKFHPDKIKKDSKESSVKGVDFKILKECYLFIKDDLEIITYDDSRCVTLQELKDQRNDPVVYGEDRNFFTTNFEDPETRKMLFPNDDVPFGLPREISTETEYSNNLTVPENIFGKKKFNLKYFNEVFEARKNINKALQVFSEPESLEAHSSLGLGGIAKYGGVIIEDSRKYTGNLANFKTKTSEKDIPLPKLKKIMKTMKKNNVEQPLEDIETLFSRKKSQGIILPPQRISMVEAEENLRKINLESTRDLLKKNKEYIKEKLHVYPENFRKNLEF
jgi:curved DNA-binding protein CbpA